MVFNPTLQSNVRFEQPVQQPDVFGAVGSILTNLGVIQQGGGEDLSDNEQFDRYIQNWQRMTGRRTPIEEWTPGELRSFQQFAGPRFGQRAVELQEELGGMGRVEERARRDMISEYRVSPRGQVDAGTAAILYPDNPEAQENYIVQSFAQEQQRVVQHEDIERRAQQAGWNEAINEEVWNTERNNIHGLTNSLSRGLLDVYDTLIQQGSITVADVYNQAGDQAFILSEVLNLNPDMTIRADNFAAVVAQMEYQFQRFYTADLRRLHPDLMGASDSFWEDVLSPLRRVSGAIEAGSDPTEIRRRMDDGRNIRLRNEIERDHPSLGRALDLVEMFPTPLNDQVLTTVWPGLVDSVQGLMEGDRVVSPSETADLSAREAQAAGQQIVNYIEASTRTRLSNPEDAARFVRTVGSLPSVLARTGDRISSATYRDLLSAGAQENFRLSGEDYEPYINNLIQHDLGLEISDLQSVIRRAEGGLVYENGRLNYVASTLVSDEGGTLGQRGLPSGDQELLDRINSKLQVLNASSGMISPVLLNSIIENAAITPVEQSGPGASSPNQQASRSFSAPRNTTQLMPNVFANASMSPIISMEGASQSVRPYAEDRMRSMLEGPFQQLQRSFGAPLVINDAIARVGTTRENQTPGSRHFHGDALDINISGMSNEDLMRLVDSALEAGFQGFGFGQGILHIDMGASRGWAYGNETFAGRPVSEMIEYARSGVRPTPDLSTTNTPVDPATERLIRSNIGESGPQLEWDENEGLARNMQVFEQTTVEQEPSGTTTPEQTRRSQTSPTGEMRQTTPIRPEIQALIENLTQQGREDQIIQFLRSLEEGD